MASLLCLLASNRDVGNTTAHARVQLFRQLEITYLARQEQDAVAVTDVTARCKPLACMLACLLLWTRDMCLSSSEQQKAQEATGFAWAMVGQASFRWQQANHV